MNNDTRHEQIDMFDYYGNLTTVDKGMGVAVQLLTQLGVITQFSCENNLGRAYVLCDGHTMKDLERRIGLLYEAGALSPASEYTYQKFLLGAREYDIAWFKNPTYLRFERRLKIRRRQPYRIERCYDNVYGFRITYRWPAHETFRIEELLDEVSRKIHGS